MVKNPNWQEADKLAILQAWPRSWTRNYREQIQPVPGFRIPSLPSPKPTVCLFHSWHQRNYACAPSKLVKIFIHLSYSLRLIWFFSVRCGKLYIITSPNDRSWRGHCVDDNSICHCLYLRFLWQRVHHLHCGYSPKNEKHFQLPYCKHGNWGSSCFSFYYALWGE